MKKIFDVFCLNKIDDIKIRRIELSLILKNVDLNELILSELLEIFKF